MKNYIETSPEAGKQFYMNYRGKGKITLLNLLKFRAIADYETLPLLAPSEPIAGKDAYNIYMEKTFPFLKEAGSNVIYYGMCGDFLIGPVDEKWDAMLLVEHESAERFVAFAKNESYLAIAGHRTAALEDSRLLPIQKLG